MSEFVLHAYVTTDKEGVGVLCMTRWCDAKPLGCCVEVVRVSHVDSVEPISLCNLDETTSTVVPESRSKLFVSLFRGQEGRAWFGAAPQKGTPRAVRGLGGRSSLAEEGRRTSTVKSMWHGSTWFQEALRSSDAGQRSALFSENASPTCGMNLDTRAVRAHFVFTHLADARPVTLSP